ncbi:TM2 domain-containing membrane protein YozV [Selenomonas sp. GACV-9]|uniref:5-bromo-4-chloroindolyl phosphate hydrolysis family protein n=1 Tax=Selenomonas sp. GACV-9 TaxID=3158782 RepID=UPI0008E4DD6E|nr:TM2 domain-containing membrane protein YozV [Selenomonas ruminantium]
MRNLYIGLGLLFLAAGAYWVSGDFPRLGMAALFAGGWSLVQGLRAGRESEERRLRTEDLSTELAQAAEAGWQKALADYDRIENVRRQIHDVELSRQLTTIQQESSSMLRYLEKHPDRVPVARRFIDYYQDRAASLSEEFYELEQTRLDTEQVRQVRTRLKETLAAFDEAYAAEFEKVMGPQLMDMDAEMTVMQQHFESEGIVDDPGRSQGKAQQTAQPQRPRQDIPFSSTKGRAGRMKGGHGSYSIVPPAVRGDVVKEKIIMSLLAIFLGCIGAHKFYQGKTFAGIMYLVLFWTFLPGFIGFIEGVRYLFMPVDDFYEKYYR